MLHARILTYNNGTRIVPFISLKICMAAERQAGYAGPASRAAPCAMQRLRRGCLLHTEDVCKLWLVSIGCKEPAQSRDGRHVRLIQHKVENSSVVRRVCSGGRDHRRAVLKCPSQQHLRRCASQSRSDGRNMRIILGRNGSSVVKRPAREGRVGHKSNAKLCEITNRISGRTVVILIARRKRTKLVLHGKPTTPERRRHAEANSSSPRLTEPGPARARRPRAGRARGDGGMDGGAATHRTSRNS